jgi:hypothetical protein
LVINYINTHSLGSGEGEAVTHGSSSSGLDSLQPFDKSREVILRMAPAQPKDIAPNHTDPRAATYQPLALILPEAGEFPSVSPSTTRTGRDPLVGRARQTLTLDDLDGVLAGLDAILPDIAEDVFHGWGQGFGNV